MRTHSPVGSKLLQVKDTQSHTKSELTNFTGMRFMYAEEIE